MWLIRKTGAKVKAHIWNGTDTACRMASTGGLELCRFEVRSERGGHEICHMCNEVSKYQTDDMDRAPLPISPTARIIPRVKELLEKYGPKE